MQSIRSRTCWALAIALATCSSAAIADTVIVRNVRGYAPTTDGVQSFAALIATDGRVTRIVKVGEEIPTLSNARVIDGSGKTLLPGLIDAHGHVSSLGEQRLQVDLRGSESAAVALDRVRTFAAANPRDLWVRGRGW